MPRAEAGLPLSALLSHTLVAFTIELDNEFEHRMPHWTTSHGGSREGPWLASMVMWWNCLRFAVEEGVTVRELERLARTKTNLDGMRRWGYITIGADKVIRPTAKGRLAQEFWPPLFGVIEDRWRERFGSEQIDRLRESLWALVRQMDVELPDCLPILGYGMFSRGPDAARRTPVRPADRTLPLPALLARVLLAFAIEFERESDLSLAISANVLRVLDEAGVRVRDLPPASGVSKEAIAMALGVLQKKRVAVAAPDPSGSRGKVVRLSAYGREAQEAYRRLVAGIEERWQARFGQGAVAALRTSLEGLGGEALLRGLEPYPDGWRAAAPKPQTLPHFPMVLHRGGFPDGS